MKDIQEASEDESLMDSSDDDDEKTIITRGFKKFLKRKSFSRQRDNKKYNGKKNKEVTCYECKKLGYIGSECPKFKFKNNGAKDKKKAFKASWDDSSKLKKEEEKQEVANLFFMTLEDKSEVTSTSHSSCDDCDDESSIVSKLMLKCKSLLSKKKLYKHGLCNLSKEFESLKNDFSKLIESNNKLPNDLKSFNSLEDELKKANDENLKLSREVLELKNSISKFKKGKKTLDSLLDS